MHHPSALAEQDGADGGHVRLPDGEMDGGVPGGAAHGHGAAAAQRPVEPQPRNGGVRQTAVGEGNGNILFIHNIHLFFHLSNPFNTLV